MGFGGTLIPSKTFAEKYTLLANASYFRHDYRTDTQRDTFRLNIWSGVIAAEAEVMHGLKLVTDFSVSTNQDKATSEVVSYALVGSEYEVCRHFSVFAPQENRHYQAFDGCSGALLDQHEALMP